MTTVKKTVNKRSKKGQFVPGNTEGVHKGRPRKEYCIPNLLRDIGKQETPESIEKPVRKMFNIPKNKVLTNLDVVLYRIYSDALKGKPHAVQFIADRTEGKALDHVEITVGTLFDKDKLKGLNDEEIRSIIRILTKIRSDEDDR